MKELINNLILQSGHNNQNKKNMTLLEAIEILSNHQKWRKGANTPATDPKQLTEALDIAINILTHLN